MKDEIVFYRLNAKVLERAADVPEGPKQVVYYSLAIGHHIGVFDCFRPMLRCSAAFYDRLVEHLPAGEARRKLEGLNRFGEITVDSSHTRLLSSAFASIRGGLDAATGEWVDRFDLALAAIDAEPAIYLMGRKKS
jgi:hydrogenase-4 component J